MEKQEEGLARPASGVTMEVTLLATSDLHAHVQPYDYYLDAPSAGRGLARVATLIRSIRSTVANCLLFDNGDTLQGTPFGDYAALDPGARAGPNPVVTAMNALGYDAAVPGNHDFNFGLDFLRDAVAGAEFPVVLANLRLCDGSGFLPATALLDRSFRASDGARHRLRIGVIGLVPPQVTMWDRQALAGRAETASITTTAAHQAQALRAQGADLVVALCHSGIGPEEDDPELENAIRPLARLARVDAIIAGHSHEVFPAATANAAADGHLHGCPVVQPGAFGTHLGRIDLTLAWRDGAWHVDGSTSRTLPVDAPAPPPPDDRIVAATQADHQATLTYIRRQIGESRGPLHSYFSMVENSCLITLIAEAQAMAATRALDGHPLAHLPLLSAAAPFKAGGRGGPANYTDIAPGAITIRNIADLYSYPNALQILRLTGAEIADWLERSAACFCTITPGSEGQCLIDPAAASYNFDVITGLRYVIDLSHPPRYSVDGQHRFDGGGRIRDLTHLGRPVAPQDTFLVATNSYRAAGGGHFAAPTRGDLVLDPKITVQDVLRRHVADSSPLLPHALPTWSFTPLPGTRAVLETGPGALRHLGDLDRLGLTHIGANARGFARFRMRM